MFRSLVVIFSLLVWVLCLVGFGHRVAQNLEVITVSTKVFSPEEADVANRALDLSRILKAKDWNGAYQFLVSHSFSEPIPNLIVALSNNLIELSYFSARVPSLTFFGLSVFLMFHLVNLYCRQQGLNDLARISVFLFAATLIILSPAANFSSVLCSSQTLGMLTLLFIIREISLLEANPGRIWLPTILSTFILILVNYLAIFTLLPALLIYSIWKVYKKEFSPLGWVISFGFLLALLVPWFQNVDLGLVWKSLGGAKSTDLTNTISERFQFYKTALFEKHFYSYWIAVAACYLALIAGVFERSKFTSFLLGIITFAAITLFALMPARNQEILFIFPAVLMLAAVGLGFFGKWMKSNVTQTAFGLGSMIAFVGIFYVPNPLTKEDMVAQHVAPAESEELFRYAMNLINSEDKVLVLGLDETMGLESYRWHTAKSFGKSYGKVVADTFPYSEETFRQDIEYGRTVALPYRDGKFKKIGFAALINRYGYTKAIVIESSAFKVSSRRHPEIKSALSQFPTHEIPGRNSRPSVSVYRLKD